MTDETKKALEAFVLQMIDAAKSGASWTAEQAPILVQEWLRWQLVEAIIIIVTLTIGSVLFGAIAKHYWHDIDDNPVPFFALLAGIILWVPLFFNILALAKVLVAPRVVVFEKFMELVK
jgi:hypothetical protein